MTAPHDTRTEDTRDDYETPPELYLPLHAEFGFTLDAFAVPETAKCEKFYTPKEDGLVMPWAPNVTWVNSPFGDFAPKAARKAANEVKYFGATVVVLNRAGVCSRWWLDLVFKSGACQEVRLVTPRPAFLLDGVPQTQSTIDVVLAILRPDLPRRHHPRFVPYRYLEVPYLDR